MWVHLMLARGFVRRHMPLWTLHVVLVAALALASGVGSVGGLTLLHYNAVDAQSISIDIVIRNGVSSEQIRELVSILNRRPDVLRSTHLDRQSVWQIFQAEIGVESEGMAEIAALPEVVRVHFRSKFVTKPHVDDVARSLKRRMTDRIEAVMVPSLAIDDIAQERTKLESYLVIAAVVGALFVISIALLIGRCMRLRVQAVLASRIGRTASWMRIGPFLGITVGTIVGVLLACVGVWLIAPWHFFYALPTPQTMSVVAAMSAPAFLLILVHASMVIVPSTRVRGWQ